MYEILVHQDIFASQIISWMSCIINFHIKCTFMHTLDQSKCETFNECRPKKLVVSKIAFNY